jgi:hypothetical protein
MLTLVMLLYVLFVLWCADHVGQVEKQLAACEKSLQAERVAHSKLQADATLERSQAAALRVRGQLISATHTTCLG